MIPIDVFLMMIYCCYLYLACEILRLCLSCTRLIFIFLSRNIRECRSHGLK